MPNPSPSVRGPDALHLYRQLLLEARPYWPHIGLLSCVNILATPIALLTPVPLKIAVDSIAGSAPLPRVIEVLLPSWMQSSPTRLVVLAGALMVFIGALDEMQRKSGQSRAPTLDWHGKILADFGVDELKPFLQRQNVKLEDS